jgi:lipid-A-disaccharide synthase
MTSGEIMMVAGEPSGDQLAAELVLALRQQWRESSPGSNLIFFGAGGPRMKEAGVALSIDMTSHAVVGLIEVIRSYHRFRRIFYSLLDEAVRRKPALVVCVDFSGFNRRFAQALRARAAQIRGWQPKIVQYVSPQVWASRPGRARKMAECYDLLLTLFPFEKDWYAKRVPDLRVEFVGHPMLDRHSSKEQVDPPVKTPPGGADLVLLLPGSRIGELKRHIPPMMQAAQRIQEARAVRFEMILPNESLLEAARGLVGNADGLELRAGGLAGSLSKAALAIASTGTVTMECAYFGVPTVAIYKTSWSTYQIGRRIIQVPFLAMPNLLAGRAVFPEFIQNDATAEKISGAALLLLNNADQRSAVQKELSKLIASLGGPGASQRAAEKILQLLGTSG